MRVQKEGMGVEEEFVSNLYKIKLISHGQPKVLRYYFNDEFFLHPNTFFLHLNKKI